MNNTDIKTALSDLRSSVKKVGFICAMDCELDAVTKLFSDLTIKKYGSIKFFCGKICGVEAIAAKCGVGKVFAAICAQTMILGFAPDLIINTGVAGNLSDTLRIGDIALSSAVVQHDMDTSPLGDPVGLISGINKIEIESDISAALVMQSALSTIGINNTIGIIASGDQFIASPEKKQQIKENFSAISCEMEGASVGHTCYVNGVRFLVVRAISDDADNSSPDDFPAYCVKVSENSSKAILEFMKMIA
ncbi:MAG: 5'-methylthioadenosine/adenosylhomocysteine nucleosidase [Ruminococcaceae bacterium]|nr:5'-methylthioadenosine/adenosylhomocysteine nucleosidase [Oscillospiraceae bacterium]